MKQDVLNIRSDLEADLGSYLALKLSCHLSATEQLNHKTALPSRVSIFNVLSAIVWRNYAITSFLTWNYLHQHVAV